ncbi:MAG: hypothetical protein OEV01_03855 [Nitrospira sp.]|nr:hypothetical protein [Nitrospira sp.]MDH4303107.1 hypothetical protein [Nitrospira sp.]MDH5192474.1 hypothetical protein [Nitrospira sp.]
MNGKQKAMVAGSLILVWAGLVVSQWNLLEEPARVPLTNITGPATEDHHMEGRGGGLHVNLSVLKAIALQRDATDMVPRNIFTMAVVEETPPVSPNGAIANSEQAPSPDILTEQGGVVASRQFRYLGFLRIGDGPQSSKSVAVLHKDDDVLVLKTGDRIDDHLVLKRITPESVMVQDSGTQREQTVVLSEGEEAEVQE